MSTAKVAITLEEELLEELDRQVREGKFPNRSRAIQEAVEEKLARMDRTRLAQESAKLDPRHEQLLADEGLAEDFEEWPAY
jgi:Arc/MetJ-type ribon-helix-helix transcriptional regulator